MTDMIGRQLGHYRVTRTIGKGGMGEVFGAQDDRLDREVALKLLPPAMADSKDRRIRFTREAKALASLHHANIVTVFSVEELEDLHFITMELVEGKPLNELIPLGGLKPGRMLDYAVPLAEAIGVAHEAGITHRDLKPQNVMVDRRGTLKVLDFGLAKLAKEEVSSDGDTAMQAQAATATAEGQVLGTPAYMSPEQAEGKAVDHRTDIFSLGVILYEMCVGVSPFQGDSYMSVISSVLRDDPPLVTDRRQDLPQALGRLIERCMAKEPHRRWQSASDLAAQLEDLRPLVDSSSSVVQATLEPAATATAAATAPDAEVASTESSVASPPGPASAPRSRSWARWLAVVGVLLVVSAAFGAGRRWGSTKTASADGPTPPASASPMGVAPSTVNVKPRGLVHGRFRRLTHRYGVEYWPTLSPDGKWFVFAQEQGGVLHLFRQRVGGDRALDLTPGSKTNNTHPAISPDGDTIAFRSERSGGGVFLMGATGETVRRLTRAGYHPAWSPDGKQLVISTSAVENAASRSGDSQLDVVTVLGGKTRRLKTGRDAAQAAWSPNGQWIAYYGHGKAGKRGIHVCSALGKRAAKHVASGDILYGPSWSPDGRHLYYLSNRSGRSNLWRIGFDARSGAVRGVEEPVTNGVGQEAGRASFSRDGRRMLYYAGHLHSNIQRVRIDAKQGRVTGRPESLTRGANLFSMPHVSPDGRWVVFATTFGSVAEDIYIARSGGKELRRLTADAAKDRFPRFTHDGKRVVFYSNRSGKWQLWAINRDGSGRRMITSHPSGRVLYGLPNPTNARIAAWVLNGQSFVFDGAKPFAGQKLQLIKRLPKMEFAPFQWAPGGKGLVGWGVDQSDQMMGTYLYSFATSTYQMIYRNGSALLMRDGRRLLLLRRDGFHLVLRGREAAHKRAGGTEGESSWLFSLSRDERWIYFSRTTADGDVWLVAR